MISTERTLVPEKAGHEDQTLRPEAMMPQMTEDIQVSVEGTMRTDGMAVQDEQTMEDSFILKGVTYRNFNNSFRASDYVTFFNFGVITK